MTYLLGFGLMMGCPSLVARSGRRYCSASRNSGGGGFVADAIIASGQVRSGHHPVIGDGRGSPGTGREKSSDLCAGAEQTEDGYMTPHKQHVTSTTNPSYLELGNNPLKATRVDACLHSFLFSLLLYCLLTADVTLRPNYDTTTWRKPF